MLQEQNMPQAGRNAVHVLCCGIGSRGALCAATILPYLLSIWQLAIIGLMQISSAGDQQSQEPQASCIAA